MKTTIIAKKLWDYALELQKDLDAKTLFHGSPLFSYPGVLTLFAGAQASVYTEDEEWISQVNGYLKKFPYEFEERGVEFLYNFDNYRVGGLSKGWMMMHGYFKDHEDVVREYAEKTLASPQTHDGVICGIRDKSRTKIWIDIVFAVVPFMVYAGLLFDEPKYLDYAVDQCFKLFDVFMDNSNGLLHQARGFLSDPEKISEDHWSRGNGWGIIGMSELLRYLPRDHAKYGEVVSRFKAHCEALIKYQDFRGLWKQEIPEKLAWEETSGTGLILYGIGIGIRMGVLDKETYLPVLQKGVEGLYRYCINYDYSIEKCCRGCLCPGDGDMKGTVEAYLVIAQQKKDDSHAFGPVILAMIEAHKNGIINITKS